MIWRRRRRGGEEEKEMRRRQQVTADPITAALDAMLSSERQQDSTDVNLPLMDCNSKKNTLQSTVYLYLLSYIMSSFCSSISPRIPHYMQSRISLGSLLWEFLRLPCFSWPWQSWGGVVRHFVEFPLTGICLLFPHVMRLQVWVWGRKTTKAQHHVCHVPGVLSAGLPAARGAILAHNFKDLKEWYSSTMSANGPLNTEINYWFKS